MEGHGIPQRSNLIWNVPSKYNRKFAAILYMVYPPPLPFVLGTIGKHSQ
jgi:hypothetical protein